MRQGLAQSSRAWQQRMAVPVPVGAERRCPAPQQASTPVGA